MALDLVPYLARGCSRRQAFRLIHQGRPPESYHSLPGRPPPRVAGPLADALTARLGTELRRAWCEVLGVSRDTLLRWLKAAEVGLLPAAGYLALRRIGIDWPLPGERH
jgi:hypothetical protein